MRRINILILTLCFVVLGAASVMAQNTVEITCIIGQTVSLDVRVSTDSIGTPATWDLTNGGSGISENATVDTTSLAVDYFTVRNQGNGNQDFAIEVATTGNWTFAANPNPDVFAMDISINQGGLWDEISVGPNLDYMTVVGANTEVPFDLAFYTPTTTTFGSVAQVILLTFTAEAS